MAKDKNHVLVKEYLNNHSLVESNIRSFNNFVGKRMQEIVTELSDALPNEDFEINLGKITVGKPNIVEADGSSKPISPAEARLRKLTYSAPVKMEMTINYAGQVETEDVQLGRIPIMIKSNSCNLADLNEEELIKNYIDPKDQGGYFLINGNERVMVMAEDLASNQTFIERQKVKNRLFLRLFSQRGAYKIPVSLVENPTGILEITFSRFRDIPAIILLKALGLTSDAEISKLIGKQTDSLIVNLFEFAGIANVNDALMDIAERSSLQGTNKEMLDRVKQRIDSYFLPHIGLDKASRLEKAKTLCKFIKQFYVAKEHPEDSMTDKDHYANKRVRLSGDLLADLFRVNINILLREIQHTLQKTVKRRKFYSIKTIAKSTLFTHRIESAIATGSWIGERTGVTQNMDKNNSFAIMSQLQRVSSTLPGEQENFAARTVHPTHFGRFCPIETPEGTEIGLRKNLALLARISTRVSIEHQEVLAVLEEAGLSQGEGKIDIFYNGRFIGVIDDPESFVNQVKEARRTSKLPMEMSVKYESFLDTVFLTSEIGRVLRPLIIVDSGVPRLKEEHLKLVADGSLDWNDLIKEGLIEYLDASEEDDCYIALDDESLTPEHTHLEIDQIDILGVSVSMIPYANHNPPARMVKGGSRAYRQGLGIYAGNFPVRVDTDVSILHYPQRPLVRSFVYDTLNVHPVGQNVVLAVMPHEGYNVEDAIVLNKASVDMGFARSSRFRPYVSVELNYAGGLKDEIMIPEKDVSGYRTEESYRFLEDDGIIYPEAEVIEGEVVIGKISPPKFLSEAREISIQTKKENSSAIKQEEHGTIDAVFVTQDKEGNKIIQVRTRELRIPELGDKFSCPHGQKGVVGLLANEEDIPFTANGVRPDMIFNPHGLPSRMTVAYLMDVLAGKVASLSGKVVDASPFSGETVDSLENQLKELGFRESGKEIMYHGVTGKKMPIKIFIGSMFYLKLKYMVADKVHARASGKIALLTRQPVEGRSRGGALRLGEMEQQALVGHGASLLLKERYDSDKVVVNICSKCGSLVIDDQIHNKKVCSLCHSNQVEPVEVSYAFKLLIEELQGLHLLTKFELKNKYDR
ncbi:DNA-directed RNA polymerase subunit B'' [archaeon]|jgi:DNA-directed RNA polymerase subunit B|nr:DNA-directed RNA polymerase subunit B'' [archaeon]MBT3577583.1 DNA-directed RNA polymerase subunit B'' [archaeon]MBT6820080.1 DNA-directed RNA polymerase subunit B'' [archaeon]MBT7025318.1 DNA-directed RNA polymerase subunit B'' [archaeon]MBT7238393.1 DNA-directed RNA polymerase subunit B'' [archaeon]